MSQTDYCFDVDQASFETAVLLAPPDQTVIVDFWAPWCAPCRTLGPVLESLVESFEGRVALAKVNVDENQALAAQFSVQGIPAVKIFKGGEMVGQFTGALPEMEIRQILSRFVSTQADDIAEEGMRLFDAGDYDAAKQKFNETVASEAPPAKALIGLAKIAIHEGDIKSAEERAKAIEIGEEGYEEAQSILNRLEFLRICQQAGGLDSVKAQYANVNELDARYAYACCMAANERYQEALDEFLAILKVNKGYNDGAAKDAMVKVFSIVGQRSPLADEYRDKLELVLY